MDFHPLYALGVQIAVSTTVVGLSNSGSIVRIAAIPVLVWCMWSVIQNAMLFMVRSPWAALMGGFSISLLFQYLDVVLLAASKSRTKEQSQENSVSLKGYSITRRRLVALSILLNFRFIGTSRQIRNIPHFNSRRPGYVPSSTRFLVENGIKACVSYLILDVLTSGADPEISSKYLSAGNIPVLSRLDNITVLEIAMRLSATIALGISMNCVQGGLYSTFGFVAVICGLSEPKSWPPFYGSILDAFSLRNFWSICWNQINTRKFLSFASYFMTDCLRLPAKSPLRPYLRVFIVFLISGVMHLLIDIASGIDIRDSGALSFFMVQIVGIAIEDIYRKTKSQFCRFTTSRLRHWERLVGYVWVLTFLTWSVPAYLFPILSRSGPTDSTIPFSIIGKARHGEW